MCYGWKLAWLCLLPLSVARKHACTALSLRGVQPTCHLSIGQPGRGAWGPAAAPLGGTLQGTPEYRVRGEGNAFPATPLGVLPSPPTLKRWQRENNWGWGVGNAERKKKTWEQKRMRAAKRNKKTQGHRRCYTETATHSTLPLLDILELEASTPWSKEII